MSHDLWLWLVFLLMGLATTLPRASFIVIGNRFTLPAVIPENPNGFQLMLIPRDGWIIMDLPALSSPD